MRLWLRGTTPITVEWRCTRRAGALARLRLVDGPREVVLAFASRRAIYELAVRLVLLWAEAQEADGRVNPRRLP
ncbi:hypothetical protein U7230_10935 [Carboxydochorda subterranea]|uniref:Uncharacterized protein n=1 Tax=Carboxydichorda subterranea TaxID=3109565 RepID=A0ABZ1BWW2_9FIRM|nr:hypothetical protein [Limnochorda sp. L945t]WRP16603.1 hypothetical protein U7230_10935 [Limnochorda sp. L945t]